MPEFERILSQNAVSNIFKYDLKLYLSVNIFLWATYLRSHCHGKDTPHIILRTNVFSLQALCTPFFCGPRCISFFMFWQDGNNSILFLQTHLLFIYFTVNVTYCLISSFNARKDNFNLIYKLKDDTKC